MVKEKKQKTIGVETVVCLNHPGHNVVYVNKVLLYTLLASIFVVAVAVAAAVLHTV